VKAFSTLLIGLLLNTLQSLFRTAEACEVDASLHCRHALREELESLTEIPTHGRNVPLAKNLQRSY
jgi:hypothetical protein